MKLRNKKTGEILITDGVMLPEPSQTNYNSLAELNKEWEDYEELKEHWYITIDGDVRVEPGNQYGELNSMKLIGNCFETEEEAKRAVEKLKAWKRLRDKEIRFNGFDVANNSDGCICGQIYFRAIGRFPVIDDLDLLFGGEK